MPDDEPTPETLALTDELVGWLAARQRARRKVQEWQATADAAQQKITAALEAAGVTTGTVHGRPACKWTRVEQRHIDSTRLRAEQPDLAEAYTTTVVSHRFTIPRSALVPA